jgi:5-methylcytosine-specific restriction endonuclease McrA
MTLGHYYRHVAGIKKGETLAVTKARQRNAERRAERRCRNLTRIRDNGLCRVCGDYGVHLHHIVPRSRCTNAQRWSPRNVLWLCVTCHHAVHARVIEIRGNADRTLVIER